MSLSFSDIEHLLVNQGFHQYGRESVSQLEHALQCAQLAEQAGETPATTAASLLHDLGHLLAPGGDTAEQDDLHQYVVLPFLRGLLPDAVLEPIRLHVDAKRYLCTVDPGYWEALSPASQHSLVLQGGPFPGADAERFARQPFAQEAIRLRRYDDHAKVPGLATPGDHARTV
jgi:phosphonate degradation associated HDIG domain protein